MKHKITLILGIVTMITFATYMTQPHEENLLPRSVDTIEKIQASIPKTPSEIKERYEHAIDLINETADAIIAIPAGKHTFANTIAFLDTRENSISSEEQLFGLMMAVHPDEAMRNNGQTYSTLLSTHHRNILGQNRAMYLAIKDYMEHTFPGESLTPKERYYATELWHDYQRSFAKNGVDLTEEELEKSKKYAEKLSELATAFERNISTDVKYIDIPESELTGLDTDFIASLPVHEQDGLRYRTLDSSTPTYQKVMRNATVEATRKKLWEARANRGYPANDTVLADVIRLRDDYANHLGWPSYAHLDISTQMAETPEKVEAFLTDFLARFKEKGAEEIAALTAELPAGVTLTADGKIKPWDLAYISKNYVINHYDLDDEKVAEYFPFSSTFDGLLKLYEGFMGAHFKRIAGGGFWDKDIMLLEVRNHQGALLGHILFDLFPRPNKYTHARHNALFQATKDKMGTINPGLSIVIANLAKPCGDKPSLLKQNDVITLFHEFGHALHALIGANELAMQSGTKVKRDFVELPSQLLELWLYDPEVLKQLAKHYKTGAPMPDAMINRIAELKNFRAANYALTTAGHSILALSCFKPGASKDFHMLYKQILLTTEPHMAQQDNDHFVCAFGHLMGYGSKYYGYLWAEVFAHDLFEYIKKQGLKNPAIGQRYVQKILTHGGTQHPHKLLVDFLGREPSTEAFFNHVAGVNRADSTIPAPGETVSAPASKAHDEL